jgi:hypothetical protein
MQRPQYVITRTKLWEQLWAIGIREIDYNKILSHPQATRYMVKFMRQTCLRAQFQHAGVDDDEPTGLASMGLGVEDDGC